MNEYRMKAEITTNISAKMNVENTIECTANFNIYDGIKNPTYTGTTEIIPSTEQQILSTKGKNLNQNIVVKPIPSNYGRIETIGNVIRIV